MIYVLANNKMELGIVFTIDGIIKINANQCKCICPAPVNHLPPYEAIHQPNQIDLHENHFPIYNLHEYHGPNLANHQNVLHFAQLAIANKQNLEVSNAKQEYTKSSLSENVSKEKSVSHAHISQISHGSQSHGSFQTFGSQQYKVHDESHDSHNSHDSHHSHDSKLSEEEKHHKKNIHYNFEYSVHDKKTGDIKNQKEVRKGDVVRGEYSLVEEGGNVRTVKYYADWKNGFHAEVHNSKNKL